MEGMYRGPLPEISPPWRALRDILFSATIRLEPPPAQVIQQEAAAPGFDSTV